MALGRKLPKEVDVLSSSQCCKKTVLIFCSFNNTSQLLQIVHTNRLMYALSHGDFSLFLFPSLKALSFSPPFAKICHTLSRRLQHLKWSAFRHLWLATTICHWALQGAFNEVFQRNAAQRHLLKLLWSLDSGYEICVGLIKCLSG